MNVKGVIGRACALLILTSVSAFADPAIKPSFQVPSTWVNQRGSTLSIDSVDTASGRISGHYINRATGFQCKNTPYPMIGWIYGTAITFTVIWNNASESCNSLTSWTGFYQRNQISTKWQLVVNGTTDPSKILSGDDTFTAQPRVNRNSLTDK